MKKRLLPLAAALAVMLACISCQTQEQAGGYQLFFPVSAQVRHGPALDSEGYLGEEAPTPGVLLAALLAGPSDAALTNPFPRNVTVESCAEDTERPGHWRVTLSEQYSGLTDVSLTLADYCVVLTLTQLEGVDSVEISSSGYSANYRSHQELVPEEALLNDGVSQQNRSPS